MKEFIRFFVKADLWPMLQWVPILPLLMLPVAPLVWLLMVAVGLSPMTWGGFFVNWLIVTVIFEAWFIYKRVRANWQLFLSHHGQYLPKVNDEQQPGNRIGMPGRELEELFRSAVQEMGEEAALEVFLEQCDLLLLQKEVADLFRREKADAEREGMQLLFKSEFIDGWEIFAQNPTPDTLRAWLRVAPDYKNFGGGAVGLRGSSVAA